MILPAVKDAEYRNLLGARVDREGNYRALAVVGDAQPGAKIVAAGAAFRKDGQRKTEIHDGIGEASGDLGRCRCRDDSSMAMS